MPDPILRQVKELAARRGTSVRAIVIESLQAKLNQKPVHFALRDASFGDGPEVSSEAINQALNEGREPVFPG